MIGLCLYYNALLGFVSTEGLSLHCVEAHLAPRGSTYNTECPVLQYRLIPLRTYGPQSVAGSERLEGSIQSQQNVKNAKSIDY